jgi:glycosyltransferase involved in cell wall biosynthesis
MKILLLCNKSPWPPRDGGSAATLSMIKGLLKCNISLTILAFNTRKHFTDASEIPGEFRYADFHFVNINTGIKTMSLLRNLLFSSKPYINSRFESHEFEKKLSDLLKNDYDAVQIEGLSLASYLPFIRCRTKAKIIFRPHNVECRIWSQLSDEEKNLFRKYYFRILAGRIKRVETDLINDFDGIAAITSVDLSWFKSNGLSKPSVVIPPGVDVKDQAGSSGINSSAIFFIGSLDWLPNINGLKWFLTEVWPLIMKAVPGVSISVAGRNASQNIVRFLKKVNVPFSGEVPSSSDFMLDKPVMIVPLFSGSGIRMKIIEGMSYGKSVVTTHCGAEGLNYQDKKDLFIAGEKEDFAGRVIDLLQNPDMVSRTAINALENVRKNYNILASAEKLVKFYSELTA